ncbi:Rha family transcriptional regulator [Bacillus sp. FSL K6-3312]|uniref:Rha family transcriptional regulator n=1 Tax=unclassified Bacillus (in: firmicutes) TaxID=185979 RepID=UPI0030FB3730
MNNNLQVIEQNGQLLVDSREVAEMVDKRHKDLLEAIRGYEKYLIGGNFRPTDFLSRAHTKTNLIEISLAILLLVKDATWLLTK